MTQATAQWLENQADRAFIRQRAQVDTAKLLATFAAGISAALVSSALQVGAPRVADTVSAWLLGGSVLSVILLVLLDRLTEADHQHVLELSRIHKWNENKLIAELRAATITAARNNVSVVNAVRSMLIAQLALSLATGVVAAFSLLT